MAEASAATVAGAFGGEQVTYAGITSTFYRRDGLFYVRTDGADGRLAEFEITYTFGIEPLQQYLIQFPGGRLQALPLAWDTRPAAVGGQRWFHMYPGETIKAGDPLHWTGVQQNWNFMCADCHSTNVRKGYDAQTREFRTVWSEISVGCESCHGPGSAHVALVRGGSGPGDAYGLTARFNERKDIRWTFDQAAGVPRRSAAKTSDRELEVCARCHSRRGQLTDEWHAGDPFDNGFRAMVLEPELYHADGQQREEVYNYASFLQSKMYASGVTCSDCHNPHSGKLRIAGDGTCLQCHQSPKYAAPEHHFHKPGSAGSACVACHMPTTTYMVVDPRHDHGFRIPRPDLTETLGVPNACTSSCHSGQGAAWAARQVARRHGPPDDASARVARAFTAVERGVAGAAADLTRIAVDAAQPPVVRAGALVRLGRSSQPAGVDVTPLLADRSPLVRRTALEALAGADPSTRIQHVTPLLSDPLATVRIEAARTLMDVADRLSGSGYAAFDRAFAELVAEQRFNADRPEAQMNLGAAWLARGQIDQAQEALSEAIRIDPAFEPAYVNLADIHRQRGNEAEAERLLREVLRRKPRSAAAHYSLGLSLVRQQRRDDGLRALGEAVRFDPRNVRYRYVYAVALHDTGSRAEALAMLREAEKLAPNDRDVLMALAAYSLEAGRADAKRYADRLLEVDPGNPDARAIVEQMVRPPVAAAPGPPPPVSRPRERGGVGASTRDRGSSQEVP